MRLKYTDTGFFAIVLACGLCSSIEAALPPLSPEEREQFAALIVTGTVSDIEVSNRGRGNDVDWVYKLQAKIDSVEKGDGSTSGDTIDIHCWNIARRPDGWAGPAGHYSVPAKGSRFKMWLKPHESGGWAPLAPNGIELLDGSPAFITPEWSGGADRALGMFAGIAVFAILVFFVLRKLKLGRGASAAGDYGDGSEGGDGGGGGE